MPSVPMPLLLGNKDGVGEGGAMLWIWPSEVVLGNALADFPRIFVANVSLINGSVVFDL